MSEVLPSTRMEESDPLKLISGHSQDNLATTELKYSGVWQRARAKLKSAYFLSRLSKEINLEANTETIVLTSVPRFVIRPDS